MNMLTYIYMSDISVYLPNLCIIPHISAYIRIVKPHS